jgi:nucleoside-diphosphate-sugar epimerase
MKILFIGGNGNISWQCVQKALENGHEVWELNRGVSKKTRRDIQKEVHIINADIHNYEEAQEKLKNLSFDVVCDFICFNEDHAKEAIQLFRGKMKQFIVISSEVVYKRDIRSFPFAESAKKNNPDTSSTYISGKLLMEETFFKAWKEDGFPVTIVRPGYTYDTILPVSIGHNCFTAIDMILQGYPLLIAGEGSNIWCFTHARDFAEAFVGLCGRKETLGEAYNISTDEMLTWNDASQALLEAIHVNTDRIFHIPYERALNIPLFQPRDMMEQRMWHNVQDHTKIKALLPEWQCRVSFEQGIRESLEWLNQKEIRKRIVPRYKQMLEELYKEYNITI